MMGAKHTAKVVRVEYIIDERLHLHADRLPVTSRRQEKYMLILSLILIRNNRP